MSLDKSSLYLRLTPAFQTITEYISIIFKISYSIDAILDLACLKITSKDKRLCRFCFNAIYESWTVLEGAALAGSIAAQYICNVVK